MISECSRCEDADGNYWLACVHFDGQLLQLQRYEDDEDGSIAWEVWGPHPDLNDDAADDHGQDWDYESFDNPADARAYFDRRRDAWMEAVA